MISFLYCQARSVRASLDQLTFNPFNPFNPFSLIKNTSRNPSNPKDWCQDSWGPDQFPAPKSPIENYHYLFNSRF